MTGGGRPAEKGQEEADGSGFVEVDPSGRFGRYPELLGKGAFKKVYKAFDELEGIEVAWNQVKVKDVACRPEDLERLYSEIHLLKTLKHKNIIKFYYSWIDPKHENIIFITEIFTSGNLRQYRSKHKHVDLRAVKNWSRQILTGLLYLHSHDPPVIHRDLKCENIFVNGNQGEVKIGDLGLATILRHTHSAHSVIGTPEFMAPEFYEEEYTELVDIYAFGLCLLEMMTFEYPYSECSNAAQIFKKVVSGIKPASLAKVTDPDVKRFIEKCIAKAPERLSAKELLMDPFLQPDQKNECISFPLPPPQRQSEDNFESTGVKAKSMEIKAPTPMISRDFKIESQRKDLHTIFIKLKMDDSTGRICNVHFPFDVDVDTSVGVASEMVAAMHLPHESITTIAEMIDSEIQCHVPEWVSGATFSGGYDGGIAPNLEPVAEDEVAALPSNSDRPQGSFVLERLPSGHQFWCDSPKRSSANSLIHTQSNASSSSSPHIDTQASNEVPDREQSDLVLINPENHGLKALTSAHQMNSTISTDAQYSDLDPGASTVYFDLSSASSEDEFTQEAKCLINALSSSDNFRNIAYKVPITDAVITCNGNMPSENGSYHVIEKLGCLLAEQQKELDELKERHAKSVVAILQELPPELRRHVLNSCKLKIGPEEIPI